ncbi:Fpg/Nei family DNA glycosylase [Bythopirellula goksoeyrii]|uniref:DNA-(apurinic or apyrimidinic site) lyase n=1 Tax=Bythopirellula goksoeyrii TaxID=1400387 RepID=A0A5B9QKM9_9BACT|nr:DNA-formamidopyrimidine glycosylase family protein [Bythopirellula goksoeyrii]QEG37596.1 Endonuclease 8 1 [Bythopirellula goksoeyrii]
MPEGHTVHRLALDHSKLFAGQRLKVSSPQGRFEEGAQLLDGKTLKSVEAHGKHLCYHWSGGTLLHVHLGLYGKFRLHSLPTPEPRGQVRLRVIGKERAFDLNGPFTCQTITRQEWMAIQDRLGPDPLRAEGDLEQVWVRISHSRAAIGSLLLNQSVIAGVGNIYRSEVLHLLGIHPETPGLELSRKQVESLWSKLTTLLRIGVKYNRIIIAEPKDIGKPRSRMNRQERLLVYKRAACSRCDAEIESWLLGARKVFSCPKCQLR